MPTLTPCFLATTPCENEIFAGDGQIAARKGSHNVKIYAENFTCREGVYPQYAPLRVGEDCKEQNIVKQNWYRKTSLRKA